ncbi:glycosyltransferase [Larkinella bovis]|uniref:Glycosyltransferase n=1 Tax=Larkinella bovis TaxID=683041 RepID=A0ABW0I8I5_9BACT
MKRLRVLHITTAHPPYDPRIVYKYCPALTERYEVYCAIPGADATVVPQVHFIRLPYFRQVFYRLVITGTFIFCKTIWLRPAIVHVYSPEFLPFAFLYQWLGSAVVYEVQENLYKKLHLKKQNGGWLLGGLFRFFDQLAQRHFSLVFTEHGYLSTYTNLAKPYTVIYNYPSLPFVAPYCRPYRKPSDPVEFFYIGWLSFERAIDTLLEGLAILKIGYPDFKMHLFGRRLFTEGDLRRVPAYRHVKENLIFYGYTSHTEAFPVAAKAVAGLALLKPIGDYPESYTTKMFEYMALGLPVITADFDLYRDVIDTYHCGYCIDPTDPLALAEHLRYLINHPQEAEQMGRKGQQATETAYNWATEQKKLIHLYDTLSPPSSL